ncbi:hypothetical protein PQX77_015606 [Marasmius sp. AFHP31]|nr:hypothetical protein PQX77_015606 [Marasmius sp. AFHP31]
MIHQYKRIGDKLFIQEVYLDPQWRGYGIGLLAVRTLIDALPSFQMDLVLMHVGPMVDANHQPGCYPNRTLADSVRSLKRYWALLGFTTVYKDYVEMWTEYIKPQIRDIESFHTALSGPDKNGTGGGTVSPVNVYVSPPTPTPPILSGQLDSDYSTVGFLCRQDAAIEANFDQVLPDRVENERPSGHSGPSEDENHNDDGQPLWPSAVTGLADYSVPEPDVIPRARVHFAPSASPPASHQRFPVNDWGTPYTVPWRTHELPGSQPHQAEAWTGNPSNPPVSQQKFSDWGTPYHTAQPFPPGAGSQFLTGDPVNPPASQQKFGGWGTPYTAPGSMPGMSMPDMSMPALNSWEISVLKAAQKYDEDVSKGWKDDMDTLMVFAALFSAVVTAFTIESYRWLSKDPEDNIILILTQISRQLPSLNISDEQGSTSSASFAPFNPSPSSVIRINSFWFLSIVCSLLSAFFGLLCKQWLREHTRDTHTRSRAEALALRQLRNESFEKWGVSSMIATLPVLLEISLLFFFTGLLELLWLLHIIPFTIAATAVGMGGALYLITTLLPALSIVTAFANFKPVENQEGGFPTALLYHFICPFKSPQAWGMFCIARKLIDTIPSLPSFSGWKLRWRTPNAGHNLLHRASHWPALDLHHVRICDEVEPSRLRSLQSSDISTPLAPLEDSDLRIYELEGLRGLVNMFHDIPSMGPHLKKILSNYEPSVVMAAVFNEWKICTWRASPITFLDVEASLEDMSRHISHLADEKLEMSISSGLSIRDGIEYEWSQSPGAAESPLHLPAYIELLYFQQFWRDASMHDEVPIATLKDYTRRILSSGDVPRKTGIRFPIPFNAMLRLWMHPDHRTARRSADFIEFYKEGWETYGAEEKDDERFALIAAFARHILEMKKIQHRCRSALIWSDGGLELLELINKGIISRQLYSSRRYHDSKGASGMKEWATAMRVVEKARRLPHPFTPIPVFTPALGGRLDLSPMYSPV